MFSYLSIFGVGGHSKVVIDIVKLIGISVSSLFDDNQLTHNTDFYGVKVMGPIDNFTAGSAFVAIGENRIRKLIDEKVLTASWQTLIHPSSIICKDVVIGEGSIIMAGSIIQPGAKIGRHCIINTGACIDHDCVIDDYVHIAPGVALAGGVKVGEGSLIGVGTSIVPFVTVGKWSTIGAGSAVISDIPDYSTAVGVPAIIKKINNESI